MFACHAKPPCRAHRREHPGYTSVTFRVHEHDIYPHKPVFPHFHQRCFKKLQWKDLQNVLFCSKPEYSVIAFLQENSLKAAAWDIVYGFWTCFRTTMFSTLTFLHCFPAHNWHTSTCNTEVKWKVSKWKISESVSIFLIRLKQTTNQKKNKQKNAFIPSPDKTNHNPLTWYWRERCEIEEIMWLLPLQLCTGTLIPFFFLWKHVLLRVYWESGFVLL